MNVFSSRERDLVKCEDMRIHAERAREFLGARSLKEFLADEMAQAAVVRCVEVVGESARLVATGPEQNFAYDEVTSYAKPKRWRIIGANGREGIEPRNSNGREGIEPRNYYCRTGPGVSFSGSQYCGMR